MFYTLPVSGFNVMADQCTSIYLVHTYFSELAEDGDAFRSRCHWSVGHLKQDDAQTEQIHFLKTKKYGFKEILNRSICIP